ncbi:MAG: response regulator [Nitrososphaerales archaeon]
MRTKRILVADSDLRVRSALHILLLQEPGPIAVAECPDLDSLVEQLVAFQPHLVLLDWDLPGRPAPALLFGRHPPASRAKLIVLCQYPEARQAALAVGADDFVYKGDPPDMLLAACRKVLDHAGEKLTA